MEKKERWITEIPFLDQATFVPNPEARKRADQLIAAAEQVQTQEAFMEVSIYDREELGVHVTVLLTGIQYQKESVAHLTGLMALADQVDFLAPESVEPMAVLVHLSVFTYDMYQQGKETAQ